jgi:hypothetical protein
MAIILRQKETPFIMRIKTNNPGSSEPNQFYFPLRPFTGKMTIDWGDNQIENFVSPTTTILHTYPSPGIYTIKAYGVFHIRFGSHLWGPTDPLKIIEIIRWGDFPYTIFQSAFIGCSNLSFLATDSPIINNIGFTTGLNCFTCFSGCSLLTQSIHTHKWCPFNCIRMYEGTAITYLNKFNLLYNPTFNLVCKNCDNLTSVELGMFVGSTRTDFNESFLNCALNQESVDDILITLNNNGATAASSGTSARLGLNGGTNATPSATGRASADALRARGWTVLLNGY